MNTQEDQREETMSLSLWALACGVIRESKGLPQTLSGQAWMRPQSKGGPVLGLHSCRALSPVPRPEHERAKGPCHLQN
jgi:hypothetical protein